MYRLLTLTLRSVPTTPPKKSRTTASRVVLGTQGGEHNNVSDTDVFASRPASLVNVDRYLKFSFYFGAIISELLRYSLSMSPLKIINALDGLGPPPPSSEVVSKLDGRDNPLTSAELATIELSKRDGKKRMGTTFMHNDESVYATSSSDDHLHADEEADIAYVFFIAVLLPLTRFHRFQQGDHRK